MTQTATLATPDVPAAGATRRAKIDPALLRDTFGLSPETMSPIDRRGAISGYDVRHRIEALVAGVTGGVTKKRIKHVYRGDGAATAPGLMILPRIPATHLFPMRHVRVLLGYTAHEICHQLKTDFKLLERHLDDAAIEPRRKQQIKEFWNAIEDYRIEREIKPIYPGFPLYIEDTRDFSAKRFCERVDAGLVDDRTLSNAYAIGAVALTWIGAELNGYRTKEPTRALSRISPNLRAWLESWRDDMAAAKTCRDAYDLAVRVVDAIDQAREDNANKVEQKTEAGETARPEDGDRSGDDAEDGSAGERGSDGGEAGDDADAGGDDQGEPGDGRSPKNAPDDDGAREGETDEGAPDGDQADGTGTDGSETGETGVEGEDAETDGSTDKSRPNDAATTDGTPNGEAGGSPDAEKPAGDVDTEKSGGDAGDGVDVDADETGGGPNEGAPDAGDGPGAPSDRRDGDGTPGADAPTSGDGAPSSDARTGSSGRPDLDVSDGDEQIETHGADLEIDELAKAINSLRGPEAGDVRLNEEDGIASLGATDEKVKRVNVEKGQGEYSRIRSAVGPGAGRAAGILRRLLQSRDRKSWLGGKEEGELDFGRLVPMTRCAPDVYRQRTQRQSVNTALCLLLDNSISMRGEPLRICQETSVVLDMAVQGTRTNVEVAGFTGETSSPVIYRYRSFGQKGQASAASIGNMQRVQLGGTPVSLPLLEQWRRLSQQKEPRRVMIVVSDGGANYDDQVAARAAHDFIVSQGCAVIGIAIECEHAMRQWCDNCLPINDVEELPTALTALIKETLR